MDGCPGDDRSKGHPIHVTIDLTVTASTQSSLPFDAIASWITFTTESPDNWDGLEFLGTCDQ